MQLPSSPPRRIAFSLGYLLSVGALAFGCQRPPTNTAASPAPPGKGAAVASSPKASAPHEIRLVLWLTIDQFRADYLVRFRSHLGPGGFARILEDGAYYTDANYAHAITETAPGHATLFTGATPAQHGIVGNAWFDRIKKAETSSVLDPSSPLIGAEEDPTKGRSPKKLLMPTIGDALVDATDGRAKVLAIATKDRSAILPGGFSGSAFWLESSGFVTSHYYGDALPAWVTAFNQNHPVEGYRGKKWQLTLPRDEYQRKNEDAHPWERPPGGLLGVFDHPVVSDTKLEEVLKATPFDDELAAAFATEALHEAGLGADAIPDLLSLSLASTDLIGHAFGPESLEAEDNFVRLDRTLENLLKAVDAQVGLDKTLIVLCADHGAVDSPEHLRQMRLPGGRVYTPNLLKAAQKAATKRFNLDEAAAKELVYAVTIPYVWLNPEFMQRRGLAPLAVAEAIAEELSREEGVYRAVASFGVLPDEEPWQRVRRSISAGRSGDIYVVLEPYRILVPNDEKASTHGSPWRYDTHVPLLLHGPGISGGRITRPVDPRALVPTVAALLGITPPPGASGSPLREVLPGTQFPGRSDAL